MSYSGGNIYTGGDSLPLTGDALTASLPQHPETKFSLFGGHELAVPQRGDLTLTITGTLTTGHQLPAMYLYGPRDEFGIYGSCAVQVFAGRGQTQVTLTHTVEPEKGGEYLVLFGTNPIALGKGDYSLTATCEGEGCTAPVCKSPGKCAVEVCATGFIREVHPDDDTLTCPTCECREQTCGAGRILIFDKCVCDCDVSLDPKPVCGEDGKTYDSRCLAECKEVEVAAEGKCKEVCEPLKDCKLDCEFGLKLEKGCKTCECAGPCDNKNQAYKPVCGSDGLTYTNADQLFCRNNQADPKVSIDSLGPCLPYCKTPVCEKTCAFGFVPNDEPLAPCHTCDCMPPPEDKPEPGCGQKSPMWCARPNSAPKPPEPGDPPPAPPENGGHQQFFAGLFGHRTFLTSCIAKEQDWTPVFANACPTGVCADVSDCGRATVVLQDTLAFAAEKFALPKFEEPPKAQCLKPKFAGVPVCFMKLQRQCKVGGPEDQCPQGSKCVAKPDGKTRCEFGCKCLNSIAGQVYDPVCVDVDGEPRTFFNACMAVCSGLTRIDYPGMCCASRLTQDKRFEHHQAVVAFCTGLDEPRPPRIFADTACPPQVDACALNEDLCCRKVTQPPATPPGDGQPPPE